jgi:lysophospholipase
MIPQTITLAFLCGLLSGCNYFRNANESPNTSAFDLNQVKADMQPLNLKTPHPPTEQIQRYFQFYNLAPTNALHYFGTVVSENDTLAAHVFIPDTPKGTLFLLHGYFDHTGTFSKLIAEGLSRHYTIVSWDLPGHGLSSGDRTDIGEFDLCAKQFKDIVQRTENSLPHPFFLITHSTGCSIALEYMYNSPSNAFDQIVFMAPLVHHAHWGWSKLGYTIAKPFVHTLRRRDKKNSSDPTYLAFVKNDPLHSGSLSLEFLDDLYAWEKQIQNDPVWPGSLLIIQGDADTVVDWKYNLKFLRKKIQLPEIYLIPGARHQLANEREELRDQVFDIIFTHLDPSPEP